MSQFVGRFPIDAVVLPNIEMKVCQFVFRQVKITGKLRPAAYPASQ